MPLRAWLWQSIWLRSGNLWRNNIATPFTPKGAHISQLSGTSYLFVKNTLTGHLALAPAGLGTLVDCHRSCEDLPLSARWPWMRLLTNEVVGIVERKCTLRKS